MPEVTGDTAAATATVPLVDQLKQAFAAERAAGPDPVETAAEAPVTETPETPESTEPVVETPEEKPVVKAKFLIDNEEVDEDTLIEWKKSGLRQSDYTKKTQEVATQAKKLEQERASEREQTLAKWQALDDAVASVTPKAPDFAALQAQVRAGTLPEDAYNRIAAEWVVTSQQVEAIKAEKQKAQAAVDADRQKASEATAKQNYERVMELIPEWKDVTVRQKDFTEMLAYVKELGEDESVLANLPPSAFKMLKDALSFHKLQQSPKPKVVKVDATLKPGSTVSSVPKTSGTETALRRVAQTHSDEDAVKGFRELRKAGLY